MNQKIKAPVNEIVAMVKLFNKTVLENGQKEYVTNINNAGTKHLNIINNDLEIARFESDSLDQTTILVVDYSCVVCILCTATISK